MTMHQVLQAFAAVNEQQTRVAWRTEAFHRTKHLPKTEDAVVAQSSNAQTPAQMKQIAKMITARAKALFGE